MKQTNISNMSTGGDQDEDLFLIITIFAEAFTSDSMCNIKTKLESMGAALKLRR